MLNRHKTNNQTKPNFSVKPDPAFLYNEVNNAFFFHSRFYFLSSLVSLLSFLIFLEKKLSIPSLSLLLNMEGDTSETPWGEVPRRERSMLKRKARVHDDGQGNVAEETTETTTTPEWVVKLMKKYEGYDANQIMELKELKATDLDPNQGRLSLPKHVDRIFLSIGELGTLATGPKKGVHCLFIVSEEKVHAVELRDWANGLVLAKGWRKVIDEEVFKIGEKYPLWSFRSRNNEDKLCFTLVKPDQVDPIEVLPNVDDKDAKLSDTEEEEVANKNEAESSLAGHDHPPESPAGVSSLPGEDLDLSYQDANGDGYLPTEAELNSFHILP
ncbi:uncharacterized protein LOC103865135 [Brassica rapa]|nr:uncharacterized protein LOC103865135 [Brassica rapa]